MENETWTIDSLKCYLDSRITELQEYIKQRFIDRDVHFNSQFEEQEKAVRISLDSAKEAVNKAEVAAEKRFESVNEFRGQLTDQALTFIPRNEYALAHSSLIENINTLENRMNLASGKEEGSLVTINKLYIALVCFGIIFGVIMHFVK